MMNQVYNQITAKIVQSGILIAKFYKHRGSLYITFLGFVIIFCPYVYVLYLKKDIAGILGFKWMSAFLFALALPITLISSGLLIRFLATRRNDEFSQYFKSLSYIITSSGAFFMCWALYPMHDDFRQSIYFSVLIVFAIAFAYISKYIQRAFLFSENKLKNIIHLLLEGYYTKLESLDLINKWKVNEFIQFRVKLTEKVAENE